MTQQCSSCKRRYKRLTEEGICFHCHHNKYHTQPKGWIPEKKRK